jgi:type VII secretion-associated serine protease mycosin
VVVRGSEVCRRGAVAWRAALTAVVACAVVLAAPVGASADSIRAQQWHLDYLRIPAAHGLSTGKGVTVAVIDSGVDITNPDLTGKVTSGFCAANPGPGNDQKPTDDFDGHGTGMAGDIAAKGGDDSHALGIAPGAKIMPICVDISATDFNVGQREAIQGIHYAVDHGASVINISLGSNRAPLPALEQAVSYALTHNVVVVAAAGNVAQGDKSLTDVARIPGVVAVSGLNRGGSFWAGSVQDPQVSVAAPAEDITSTDSTEKTDVSNTSNYGTASGTSDAAAIVSGVVALIRSKYPKLDAVNVINRLVKTADDRGVPGRDPQYGFGVVDPVKALTADVSAVSANPLGMPPTPAASVHSTDAGGISGRAAGKAGGGGLLVVVVLVVVVLVAAGVVVGLFGRRRRRASEIDSVFPNSGEG